MPFCFSFNIMIMCDLRKWSEVEKRKEKKIHPLMMKEERKEEENNNNNNNSESIGTRQIYWIQCCIVFTRHG